LLKIIDLTNDVDIKGLLAYRLDLIKAIAIALNIPYDMLLSDSSNRATSEVAMEIFNTHQVRPIQNQFVKQLRRALRPIFGGLVMQIDLIEIDTKNQKEEMEINT
jgi:phage portal protein BeeE